jgi:cytoskeletal protein CcmA (bactofilin family)
MVSVPNKSDEYPTVIGSDATFKGELSFQGSVRIDGSFEGGIKTPGSVYISQTGKVKAEIKAGDIKLDGSVEGNMVSEGRVQLNASCKLLGDVKAAKLLVAEGATWAGRCEVGAGAAAAASAGGSSSQAAMRQVADAASGKK